MYFRSFLQAERGLELIEGGPHAPWFISAESIELTKSTTSVSEDAVLQSQDFDTVLPEVKKTATPNLDTVRKKNAASSWAQPWQEQCNTRSRGSVFKAYLNLTELPPDNPNLSPLPLQPAYIAIANSHHPNTPEPARTYHHIQQNLRFELPVQCSRTGF